MERASTQEVTPVSSTSEDVDGNGLAIAGLVAGLLGLGLGGTAFLRTRKTS